MFIWCYHRNCFDDQVLHDFTAIWAPSQHLETTMQFQLLNKKRGIGSRHYLCFKNIVSLQLLKDKFREFTRETGMVGQERVDMVNQTIDELIEAGHTEAATMAEWKDSINESWADLLELIDTRAQLLTTSYELLK